MAQPWDAFISYARVASTSEVVSLQHGIETFAKAWNQLRGCRVFRDDSSMSANAELWPTIERALTESRYLVLICSPAAAESEYVNSEVVWWIGHKTVETILLVHDDGTLAWDRVRNDFSAETNCVPPALRGAFPNEPRWVDFSWFDQPGSRENEDPRFPEVVADLAAPIRGMERDELIGESVTQLRRARRLARAGVSGLVVLLIVAIIAAVAAFIQRNEIAQQAVTLQARQLAGIANRFSATDVQRSQLFAVAGLRSQDSQETRSALLGALASAPALEGFQVLPAEIDVLQVAPGGRSVAVGLENGAVYRIDPSRKAPPTLLFELEQRVVSLSLAADGSTVAAVDSKSTVKYWRDGRARDLSVPKDKSALLVAVSPDGLTIMVNGPFTDEAGDGSPGLDFFDARTGVSTIRRIDPHSGPPGEYLHFSFEASFIDDHRIVLVDSSQAWTIMNVADGGSDSRGSIPWNPTDDLARNATLTRSGLWYVDHPASQGELIDVWSTLGKGTTVEGAAAPLSAAVPFASVEDIDVTADGRWVVVSDATGLLLRGTDSPSGRRSGDPLTLRLTGAPVASQVAFLDSPTRLVSVSRDSVAFWNTESPGRLAEEAALLAQSPVNRAVYNADDNDVRVALSPDGSSYAMVNLNTGVVQRGSVPGRLGVATSRVEISGNEVDDDFRAARGVYWLDDQNVGVLCAEAPPNGSPDWLQPIVIGDVTSVRVSQDRTLAVGLRDGEDKAVDRFELPSGRLLSSSPLDLPDDSLVNGFAVSSDGAVAGYLVEPYDDTNEPKPIVFVDSSTGSELHHEDVAATDRVLIAIDGLDAVIQFGTHHAEFWKDLGRSGKESFGEDLLTFTAASRQNHEPVFSGGSMVALTTKTGLALYAREGLGPIASLSSPTGRAGHPRVSLFAPDGGSLLTAYLGPTEATARLTSLTLDVATQRARACATAGRELASTEWTRVVGPGTAADLACA